MTCVSLRTEAEIANDTITMFNRRFPPSFGGWRAGESVARRLSYFSGVNFESNIGGELSKIEADRSRGTSDTYGLKGQSDENEVRVSLRQCPKCKQILSNCVKVCIHCDEVISKSRSKHGAKSIKIACILIGLQLINTAHAFYNSPVAERISISRGQVEIAKTPNPSSAGLLVPL